MITKKFLSDESGLTVALETILLFAISVIFLGMIFYSFQDMNQRQSKILVEEELLTIGNSIAQQMSDMTVEARASNALGSDTTIKSEFWIPYNIADNSYRVTLMPGKIILESTSPPYISVEVPVSSDINLFENSTIYSNDGKYTLEYDSKSSAIYFSNGGDIPPPDAYRPTISIDSPPDNDTISLYTYINVTADDNVGVTRVEYYVNEAYRYTSGFPYKWLWNTQEDEDGNYTVTAVAYDAAGYTMWKSRNYTIYNPFSYAPVITIISPLDGENTTFKKPKIEAKITDDKAIDFSKFLLKINGADKTANITFNNDSSKLTTLSYTPSQNMAVGQYLVQLRARDMNATPLETWANWSFNITNLTTDYYDPTVNIIDPTVFSSLAVNTPILVKYSANDNGVNDSGIDNLTITVRRGDGVLYSQLINISEYPDIIYSIPPQRSWEFTNNYLGGNNYTYNITIFDRSGRRGISTPTLGPLTVALPGQASELGVDTSANYTQSAGKSLRGINIKDNVSDTVTPTVSKMTVSWVSNSTEKITSINFGGGGSEWTGSSSSGTQITISPTYQVTPFNTNISLNLGFDTTIIGKTFTIRFQFSDSTTSTVTFYVP
jgi:hypothetical protein